MADLIDINLEDVEDGFEPLPEGTYGVSVKSAEWRKKPDGEYPYMNVEMKPSAGQVEEKYRNKSLFLTLSLHPKALWNMKAFFKATNMPLNLKGQDRDEIARALLGRTLRVTVGIRIAPNGNKQNEVTPPYHAFVG